MQQLKEYDLTLRYHSKLNPKLWIGEKLLSDVRSFLLKEAYEFAEFAGISKTEITDIVFTGSCANRNYTKFSDLDVHVFCDMRNLNDEVLYKKKVDWNKNHQKILHGYPVELYAQPSTDSMPDGQGVFSLLKDKWVVKPKDLGDAAILKDPGVISKVKHYVQYIARRLIKSAPAEEILEFKEKMWKGRTSGLAHGGEFSIENIVYKALRNMGWIEKINDRLEKIRKD